MIESVVSDLSGRHRHSKVESESRKARNRHPNRERLTNRLWDHVNFRMFCWVGISIHRDDNVRINIGLKSNGVNTVEGWDQ